MDGVLFRQSLRPAWILAGYIFFCTSGLCFGDEPGNLGFPNAVAYPQPAGAPSIDNTAAKADPLVFPTAGYDWLQGTGQELPAQTTIPDPAASSLTSSDQKLGEAPPPTNMEFLRRQSVLLKPCEWQIDVGFYYLYHEEELTLSLDPSTVIQSHIRQRILAMPLEFRYGLCDRVQLFANVPFGWANTETGMLGTDDYVNEGGVGDTNTGATIHLFKSNGLSCSPDIITTFGVTAPTGKGNAILGIFLAPETTLGQGFWAGYWNALFIHQYDPVIVYYGFGSRHYVSKEVDGIGQRPGDQFTYQLGTGFAVNERITLSTTFYGSYITEAWYNGARLPGTIQEPMYLRFATTITRPNKHVFEPFVEVGMTKAAADSRVGVTWTF